MKALMNANEGGPTWLCSSAAERERLLDMEERIKPVRTAAFGLLAVALLVCAPWVGWWTLAPLVIAGLGFALVDRFLEHTCHPEFPMAAAWILAQIVIATSVALTGGPDAASVAWLVIPVCTLPARYGPRGVTAGVLFSAVLMVIVTLGVDPSVVLAHPEKLAFPLAMLGAVALLSVALMRSDVEHRSEAVIDPLTGMLNRNALTTRTAELAQQAAVVNQPVALIVGDLDRFKSVNDGHGHAAGDAVLKDVAYRMRKSLRAYDLAYRLGGEEFLIVLPGADAPQAAEVAEALRAAIADDPIAGLLVTISFGVSASEPGEFQYDASFAEADLALYRSKQEGRNRVRVNDAGELALVAA
jgi:diguanylate cyclase (GGDEF)-like protein